MLSKYYAIPRNLLIEWCDLYDEEIEKKNRKISRQANKIKKLKEEIKNLLLQNEDLLTQMDGG